MKQVELHLIVLWETARAAEERILADIRARLEVVGTGLLEWPGDAETCFGEFYGANLPEAAGKVRECGSGAFRYVVVRDANPGYSWEDTSRGLERVNTTLFGLKNLYRSWTGGGHKVHTTNSSAEFARDIMLLTGHGAAEWERGVPEGALTVLPGHGGWKSLRDLFAFLDPLLPYVVLRNAEMLPDAFSPDLHGDIDLLVPDAVACASLLGARKVFPEDYRVHYEVIVAGAPVRFDFRFVGDGYYPRAWQERMLANRRQANGVNLLAAEDAFYALVYHALYQKRAIASDYRDKAAALARAAGLGGADYDDWLLMLEDFLKRNDYAVTEPEDHSVYVNADTIDWRRICAEIEACGPFADLRPYRLEDIRAENVLQTRFFRGTFEGRPCFVKYFPTIGTFTREEWRIAKRLHAKDAARICESLFWHRLRGGGSFVATEFVEGTSLESLLAKGVVDERLADRLADEIAALAALLRAEGILHRDIRPANLIVRLDGSVKLIDFQFAIGRDAPELLYREPALARDLLAPRILLALGDTYAMGRGRWNDAHSLMLCLDRLPTTAHVRDVRDRLWSVAQTPDRVGLGPQRVLRKCKRLRMKLGWRRLLSKLGYRKRQFKRHDAGMLVIVKALIKAWNG